MQLRLHLFIPFLSLLLLTVACEQTGDTSPDEPRIVDFDSSSGSNAVAPNTEVTLNWTVNNATSLSIDNGVGTVTGTSTVVTPTQTTTYTLTARNGSRTDTAETEVRVTGDSGGGDPTDTTEPTGTFGVSTSQSGPFLTDDTDISDADDSRIIDVAPGGTFYAEVEYSDPSGITDIDISLVNSAPPGLSGQLPKGGFSVVGDPTGADCDLTSDTEDIVCIYEINVAEGTQPITALPNSGDEFAYVFRAQVTDGAGNRANDVGSSSRGYVNITSDGSNPPTNPPANSAPSVSIADVADLTLDNGSATANLDATVNDAENDTFSYQWSVTSGNAGDVSFDSATAVDTDVTFSAAGNYTLQLTATDTDDSSSTDSATVGVTVNAESSSPPANQAPTADITVSPDSPAVGDTVTLDGTGSDDPDGANSALTYAWTFTPPSGSTAQLSATNTPSPTFEPDIAGDYQVSLSVTDEDGAASETPASETITVGSTAPVIIDEPAVEAINDNMSGEGPVVEIEIDAELLDNDTYPNEGYSAPQLSVTDSRLEVDDGKVMLFTEGFTGITTFEYTFSVTDLSTQEVISSNPATVTVNVTD